MSKTNKVGRPTKYTEDMPQKMLSYFNIDSFYYNDEGKPVVTKFPSFARFALNNDISIETLNQWQKMTNDDGDLIYPEFSEAYKKCKMAQEAWLYECGLAGAIDKTFGIWATKTLLGHKEPNKTDTVILKGSLSSLVDDAADEE